MATFAPPPPPDDDDDDDVDEPPLPAPAFPPLLLLPPHAATASATATAPGASFDTRIAVPTSCSYVRRPRADPAGGPRCSLVIPWRERAAGVTWPGGGGRSAGRHEGSAMVTWRT